ncbi:uncharacterized protein CDAR_414371 [Caerostris darwini]|uniref:VWFC domain-containing protein n=1 Tax=Caerostris darwini TaxID=1538125 RepID=A0AAV4RFF6_9ARAC|nr:uncharacterized protein CDAR_414371 [Caerostris darwini]
MSPNGEKQQPQSKPHLPCHPNQIVPCFVSITHRSCLEFPPRTCFYNGTWFQESEELPTRGLCLICHCFPGFVEPNAFTCSVIDCPWEDYHRRFPGCTPIYADRDCCPIGWECGMTAKDHLISSSRVVVIDWVGWDV